MCVVGHVFGKFEYYCLIFVLYICFVFVDIYSLSCVDPVNYSDYIAVKLKMINQDRMIFDDFSVNFEPISLKFCRGHFLLKS